MKTTAVLAVLLGLAAFPAVAAEEYPLETMLPLSGNGAFLGRAAQHALRLEEKVINAEGGIHGRPVRFVFHDDQSNPQLAVQLASEMIAGAPSVIFGSILTATCNAMAPLMRTGPVMYCFSSGIHPPAGSFVFTASTSSVDNIHALVRFYRLKGWTRLALMTSTDATGQDADHAFDELFARPENKDLTVVEHAHFGITDVSVSAQLERVKSAGPQAMIVWSTGTPLATIFRGAVQAGLAMPIGTTPGNMTYAQMTQFAAFLPKPLYLPSSEWPVYDTPQLALGAETEAAHKRFFGAYAAVGEMPDEGGAVAWDPVSLVVEALRRLPPGADAARLHDYLLHLHGAAGIAGVYDFEKMPQRGLSLDNTIVTRWDAGANRWQPVAKPTGIPLDAR